jgi:hypothetical protein
LNPVCILDEPVGDIPAGEVLYIPEFKDGQTYLRNSLNKLTVIEHDTLKEAVAQSPKLA